MTHFKIMNIFPVTVHYSVEAALSVLWNHETEKYLHVFRMDVLHFILAAAPFVVTAGKTTIKNYVDLSWPSK